MAAVPATGSVTVKRVRPAAVRSAATRAAVTLDDRLHDPQSEAEAARLRLLVRGAR